jgi:hypothetical protein
MSTNNEPFGTPRSVWAHRLRQKLTQPTWPASSQGSRPAPVESYRFVSNAHDLLIGGKTWRSAQVTVLNVENERFRSSRRLSWYWRI